MNPLSLGSFPRPNSEGSIDTSNLAFKLPSLKRGNPQLEKLRNSLKDNLFPLRNPVSLTDLRTDCSALTTGDSQGNLEVEHKKNHQSESFSPNRQRSDKKKHSIKGSLLFLSEQNSLSFSPESCKQGKENTPVGFGDIIRPFSLSGVGSFVEENCKIEEDSFPLRPENTLSEIEEVIENVRLNIDNLQPERKDDLIGAKVVLRNQRWPIFYDSAESEVEDIKKELKIDANSHIHFFKGDFSSFYKEGKILGEGTSGLVKRCTKVDSDEAYAVKIIPYRGDNEILTLILKEFGNMRKLNHKNIIKVYELYVDYFKKRIYTIMELAECSEMFEVLKDLGHYSEQVASGIFKQILTAINYLHMHGVCHRDIKPNNILVSKDGKIVKITDFNVSKFLDQKDHKKKYSSLSTDNYKMWTYTGTIAFTAPEVFLNSDYAEGVDIWSAGVVLYTMLCGYQPFQAEYVQDLIELIKEGLYKFHSEEWNKISDQAKDLVRHCLDKNPKTRYSPSDALMHPWIANQGKVSDAKISNIKDNFRSYYKKYASKKNFTCPMEMKRVQVTSPNFGVALAIIHQRKRSGTMQLNAPYFSKRRGDKNLIETKVKLSEIENVDKVSGNTIIINEEIESFEIDRRNALNDRNGLVLHINNNKKNEICIKEHNDEE